ncbi:hypothetical protein F5Y08DRAFT_308773 [Xylaria arbuscula]|nr:hypothetical protein F5Y08DRAFT_308773 [Xylaria arbuscula]
MCTLGSSLTSTMLTGFTLAQHASQMTRQIRSSPKFFTSTLSMADYSSSHPQKQAADCNEKPEKNRKAKGFASPGSSVIPGTRWKRRSCASTEDRLQERKN